MMLGILTTAGLRRSGSLSGPLASIDFVAGSYIVNGVTLTAADVVDKPARIGASGLEILDNDADGVVEMIGDLATLLLPADNWTVVLEYEETKSSSRTSVLYVTDDGPGFDYTLGIDCYPLLGDVDYVETTTVTREVDMPASVAAGVHRIAATRTAGRIAMSVDGGAMQSDATASIVAFTHACFGGWTGGASNNGTFIRSLTVYPAQADSVLPALSA